MPSMPSKSAIEETFPQLSADDVAIVWNAMFNACVQLANPNLREDEVEAIGYEVLLGLVVRLGQALNVEDVGIYTAYPTMSVANYVNIGDDWAPTLLFSREGRAFELTAWRDWVAHYRDDLADVVSFPQESSWEASA